MHKTKAFYLYKFRRIACLESLEKLVDYMTDKVPGDQIQYFHSAADHRRAELLCHTLFDKVPPKVWHLVH